MPASDRVNENDLFSAGWANRLRRDVDALRITSDGSIHVTHKPDRQVLKANVPQEGDFLVTSGDGAGRYAGTEVRPDTGGTWVELDGGRTPTLAADPLYERNLSGTVVTGGSVVVRAIRNGAGAWTFDRGACS